MDNTNNSAPETTTTEAPAKKVPASARIVEYLREKGKAKKQAGVASTQEIAEALGLPLKYTYDRLYWLAKRENRLLMTGSGKSALWRSVPKARKAKAAEELEGPPVPAAEG